MTGVLIKGDKWRKHQLRTKAESGLMQLQEKGHKRLPTKHQERRGKMLLQDSEGA